METNKVVLIIMDGWGIAENDAVSAIAAAHTPFYDQNMANRPNIRLKASEESVGLPEGQFGNSEVGHTNIGAGRVVYQELVRINLALKEGTFLQQPNFQNILQYCKQNNKPLHLLGLLSDGGVHAMISHLKGIISLLAKENITTYIHAFTDGRDTDPRGGLAYMQDLEQHLAQEKCGKVVSVIGRYYAMDRDKRWERVEQAYDLLVKGEGMRFTSAQAAIEYAYSGEITDEFIKASVIVNEGEEAVTIQAEDAVFFFNFRTDRGRELTQMLTQKDMPKYATQKLKLHFTTMTRYDESFENINVVYEKQNIQNGLGEHLSKCGKEQIRIAETEKYPHVTFFFNGGAETPFRGEHRILCSSPKVATYDMQPEMSAYDIQNSIVPELKKQYADFVCLNFANPDMVGHTGVFEAAVKACTTVDECTKKVAETALANGYKVLITADHGNADKMRNEDSSPHTAHTTALVPLILLENTPAFRFTHSLGKLGDLAPTILTLMNLPIPDEMTGDILVEKI
ncbi:MAG: 2,3-bisphosphoglycerate-independent phosphoglycerate mutase [Bacteroidia bacterium]